MNARPYIDPVLLGAIMEPEVVQSTLAAGRERSLANIIAALLNENEPLLKAEHNGKTVTVRERGGGAMLRFHVEQVTA